VIKTPELIDALVADAGPIRPLRPPLVRAALWLLFAVLIVGLIAIAHGVRADLAQQLQQPLFVISMFSALATGILAAIVSFRISLPDSSRWWALLPLPPLALWLSTIGYGCLTDWVSMTPDGMRLGETLRCFATLVMTSVPLSIAMLVMLRYTAMLRALEVSMIGGLAVAAITAFALSLFHDLDASVMVLVWNLGVAALIAGLASLFGRSMFNWIVARLTPYPRRSAARR
jgi:hypothetical protein